VAVDTAAADRSEKEPSKKASNALINRMLTHVAQRAEKLPEHIAHATFVSNSELTDSLSSINNQVVYGRRGSGKTHAFRNLAASVTEVGDLPIYVDLRIIGSNGGLYGDTSLSRPARGTQLLIDVLAEIHTQMCNAALLDNRFEALLPYLDAIAEAMTEVKVEGPVSMTEEVVDKLDDLVGGDAGMSVGLGVSGPTAKLKASGGRKRAQSTSKKATIQRSGREMPRVLFGAINSALTDAVKAISPQRVWLMLDEWSSIPLDLQPILGDLIRRSIFPVNGVTVKIAAVERRSEFYERLSKSDYLGIELGTETAAAINLDVHLLDEAERVSFFRELLYRHLCALGTDGQLIASSFTSASHLTQVVFGGNHDALLEFVRASEGVPRDALQIVSLAASLAKDRAIKTSDIRNAARKFYVNDKQKLIERMPLALLTQKKLIKEVFFEKRSRTFMVRRNMVNSSPGILELHDARLIHLMQPGLYLRLDPGTIFDCYCLDFGSYIQMLETEEQSSLWNARRRPDALNRREGTLSDSFDSAPIFTPPRGKKARSEE